MDSFILHIADNQDIAASPVFISGTNPSTGVDEKYVEIFVLDRKNKARLYQKRYYLDDKGLSKQLIVRRGQEVLLNTMIDAATVYMDHSKHAGFTLEKALDEQSNVYLTLENTTETEVLEYNQKKFNVFEPGNIVYLFHDLYEILPYAACQYSGEVTFAVQKISDDACRMKLVKLTYINFPSDKPLPDIGERVVYDITNEGDLEVGKELTWHFGGQGLCPPIFFNNTCKYLEAFGYKKAEIIFRDKHYIIDKNDAVAPVTEESTVSESSE